MEVKKMDHGDLEDFLVYCRTYGSQHDDSYLYPDDLKAFEIGDKNPTYLLYVDEELAGVLSLMIDDYYLGDQKTRVRIFHCQDSRLEYYQALLDEALKDKPDFHQLGIHKIEMFIPERLENTISVLKTLNFDFFRTSYVMVRKNKKPLQAQWPEGYCLKAFEKGKDEKAYLHIRNAAFKNLKGSTVPLTETMVKKLYEDSSLLKDGMQLLYHWDQPVGIIRVIKEIDETGIYSFVAPIALLPDYQGKGLGSNLLRAGVAIGQDNGLDDSMLVVNAENQLALGLYMKTGYELDMAVSCYQRNV